MTSTAPLDLDITNTTPIPFGRLVGVEFRKARDTRASFWLLAVIAIAVVLAEVIALIVGATHDDRASIDFGTFTAVAAFLTSVLLPVLAIMLVTTEWTQRSAMVTFTLESRRSRVVLAKLVIGVLLTFATIALATVVGALANLLLGVFNGPADWTYGWDGFFGFIIGQNLAMLVGFALASLTLNTAAAIVLFFVYQFVLPTLFAIGSGLWDWFSDIAKWVDFGAAQNALFELSSMTGAEWAHLVVSGLIWLGIPLTLGLRRILGAEVK
jgi:ABC-type transport system involved in multi-copper enzyme maturation permease subunit